MAPHFDTNAEDEKLAQIHREEEEDLAQILSQKYGIGYADLTAAGIDMEALRLIPEAEARAAEAVAFNKESKKVSVGVKNLQNPALADVLQNLAERGFAVSQFLISKASLEKTLSRYKELSMATVSTSGEFAITPEQLAELSAKLTDVSAAGAYLTETLADKNRGVSSFLEGILATAFALRASDIHIEPEENAVRLRLRLDGVLTDVISFDERAYAFLNSRLKILSGLLLNVRDRAQDGRFSVNVAGTDIEIRASLIPGQYGESFVMRLLDPSSLGVGFDNLGIEPKLLERLTKEIARPNGMLLTTGPTGSGKTTTLYSFLKKIHTKDIKIVTIEDPIEYHLDGITQTQVGKEYTFASGLRSIVRQDPDVIMVGEIRDAEAAGIAIQAALTGHFVYSTLHTNDAAGTFPRLVDLGVDPKEFASAVTVSMAQRLVRKLDPDARKQVPLEGENKEIVEKVLASIVDKSLVPADTSSIWVADPKDGKSGYKGRIGIYEAIFMDDQLGTFLRSNPSTSEIKKEAARQGYLTMVQDGVLKALNGITSLEEVLSVADLPRD